MKTLHGFSGLRNALVEQGLLKPVAKRLFLKRSTPEWARAERERKIKLGLIIPANINK